MMRSGIGEWTAKHHYGQRSLAKKLSYEPHSIVFTRLRGKVIEKGSGG
jgi:hypothetical protein